MLLFLLLLVCLFFCFAFSRFLSLSLLLSLSFPPCSLDVMFLSSLIQMKNELTHLFKNKSIHIISEHLFDDVLKCGYAETCFFLPFQEFGQLLFLSHDGLRDVSWTQRETRRERTNILNRFLARGQNTHHPLTKGKTRKNNAPCDSDPNRPKPSRSLFGGGFFAVGWALLLRFVVGCVRG